MAAHINARYYASAVKKIVVLRGRNIVMLGYEEKYKPFLVVNGFLGSHVL